MTDSLAPPDNKLKNLLKAFLVSAIILLVLFFLEESPYDLDFHDHPFSILSYFIHLAVLWICQYLTFVFILQYYHGRHKVFYTCLIGIPLGLLSIYVFMAIRETTLQS
jgi:hypothetical protein